MTQSLNRFRITRTPAHTANVPTVLLIHGFLDDASVWDDLVDALGGEVGAMRYDLPGFGTRSGSVADARAARRWSPSPSRPAMSSKGIDGPVIVVGQSFGTQVAELVAAQHSDRVRGLVLLTPVPRGGTQLPDEVVAPFGALGGDRDAQRACAPNYRPTSATSNLTGSPMSAPLSRPTSPPITSTYGTTGSATPL